MANSDANKFSLQNLKTLLKKFKDSNDIGYKIGRD